MSIPETPYTRLEMYLDEIARNGGGGGGGGGGSSSLSGLTDVDISNPTNGQTLVYNATSGKWENGAGGGSGVLVVHEVSGALDKTWAEIQDSISNGIPVFIFTGSALNYPPQCVPVMYCYNDIDMEAYLVMGIYFEPTNNMQAAPYTYMAMSVNDYPAML